MPGQLVDDDAIEAFARDGVIVLRGILNPDEVSLVGVGIDKALAAPSKRVKHVSDPDESGAFVEDFLRWSDVDEIKHLAFGSRVGEAAAALMDSMSARFYHDHLLVKEANTSQVTPWHQDQPYYNVEGTGISAWLPADPVPKDASPEFWAGSHLGPWRMPRSFLDKEANWFPEGSLAEIPNIEADRSAYDIRQWALQPGDAIFFSFLALHSAPGFPYEERRRALSLRYLGSDARHVVRSWATSPSFEGIADDLADGDSFDHPSFPLAWPRTEVS